VFAPGEPTKAYTTGDTDGAGRLVFDADRDGVWSAEAPNSTEIARIAIRLGSKYAPRE
jgi:hypothetical protein